MRRNVVTIPARVNRFTEQPINEPVKRRVAGYARVSTDDVEQLSSYQTQVKYYTEYIKSREDWEFAGMYTDEGISATNTRYRKGFNQMVADALAGKIDLIITKSVSRFARNTVDSLTTVRTLKEHGIEVYFEKENIWTLDSKGELLITIMSSLAQEESRNISENVKWGQRKRFAAGKVSVGYSHFLGYDKGPDGRLVINKEQAKTVRLIYQLFLEGLTYYSIASELMRRSRPSPTGGKRWHASTIGSILKNEKYKGDALLQKRFTVDFLSKRQKVNEGEVPQYYVENDHEAIISPSVFDMVQAEIKRRGMTKGRYSGINIFSSKIKCGECGSWFGSKVWHSTDKYRRTVYRCNHKFAGGKKCSTPHLTEEEIKALFVKAVNLFLKDKKKIVSNLETLEAIAGEDFTLQNKLRESEEEMRRLLSKVNSYVDLNSRVAMDQNEYRQNYQRLVEMYNTEKARHDEIANKLLLDYQRKQQLKQFIEALKQTENLIGFDESLWTILVDYVTVFKKDDVRFTFKNGMEIKVGL